VLASVAPATAATAGAATLGELQSALADCTTAPNTITLTADIIDADTGLTISCDTTIDLGIHDLTVHNVDIVAGNELVVTGPTDGTEGTLSVDRTGDNLFAAIRTTGATLRVTGGAVRAIAGDNGAAIGGDSSASGGTLIVEGGEVYAEGADAGYGATIGGGFGVSAPGHGGVVAVSGGTLTAIAHGIYNTAIGGGGGGIDPGTAGTGATLTVTGGVVRAVGEGTKSVAIGGGSSPHNEPMGAAGGTTIIGAGGTVIASAPYGIGGGIGPARGAFASWHVAGVLSLPSGAVDVLDSSVGAEIRVSGTGSIIGASADPTLGASITGTGQIANSGIIALSPPAAMVAGNNRLVTFSNGSPSVRVFAPTLAAGYRSLASPPADTAWNTAADGSGSWFTSTSSTAGAGTTALFAVASGSLEVSSDPADLTATVGQPFTFPVTGLGPDGEPLDPQPTITYASDDCTISGAGEFATVGTCTITASATIGGLDIETEFVIEVVAGPVDSLTITLSATSVNQGGSLTFQVAGEDALGNPVDTSGVVLTSSVPTDVISGLTVRFPHASPHVITASVGGVSTSVTIEVVPTPAALGDTGLDAGPLLALGALVLALLGLGAGAVMWRRRAA